MKYIKAHIERFQLIYSIVAIFAPVIAFGVNLQSNQCYLKEDVQFKYSIIDSRFLEIKEDISEIKKDIKDLLRGKVQNV